MIYLGCTEAESSVFADLGKIRLHEWGQLKSHWIWVNRVLMAPCSEGTLISDSASSLPSQIHDTGLVPSSIGDVGPIAHHVNSFCQYSLLEYMYCIPVKLAVACVTITTIIAKKWNWGHFAKVDQVSRGSLTLGLIHRSDIIYTTISEGRGVNPGGWGSRPPDFGQGGSWGSWTGRKILLYIIIYRKCVRKWWLLMGNIITCPETAVNSQFLPGKSNFFVKLPRKSKFFGNLPWKIEIYCEITWKISKFYVNLP